MTPTHRTLRLWLAAAAVAIFCAASIAAYRSSGATKRSASLASLKRALAALDDDALDSTARVSAYRDGLSRTDALLQRTLRGNPTDTAAIERLAMVRWELGVLTGGPDINAVSSLMDIAALRAPRVPEIQAELGELAYRMGRGHQAAPFLRRSVELSPSMTNRAVASMRAAGVEPREIVQTLPPVAEVLIATKPVFMQSGHGMDYLDVVESRLGEATPSLLMAYGEASVQLGVPARLKERILELAATQDLAVQAERSCQLAHAWLSLGDPNSAMGPASDARRIAPHDARIVEFYGEVALAAGNGTEAESAFRKALELVLTADVQPARRARLYDALGRAFESQGHPDFAYDAFRRAVALDPAHRNASARVAAYEHRSSGPRQ